MGHGSRRYCSEYCEYSEALHCSPLREIFSSAGIEAVNWRFLTPFRFVLCGLSAGEGGWLQRPHHGNGWRVRVEMCTCVQWIKVPWLFGPRECSTALLLGIPQSLTSVGPLHPDAGSFAHESCRHYSPHECRDKAQRTMVPRARCSDSFLLRDTAHRKNMSTRNCLLAQGGSKDLVGGGNSQLFGGGFAVKCSLLRWWEIITFGVRGRTSDAPWIRARFPARCVGTGPGSCEENSCWISFVLRRTVNSVAPRYCEEGIVPPVQLCGVHRTPAQFTLGIAGRRDRVR